MGVSSGLVLRLVFVQPAAPRNTSVGQRNKACSQDVVLPLHTHTPPSLESSEGPHRRGPLSRFQPCAGTAPVWSHRQNSLPMEQPRDKVGGLLFVSDTLQLLPFYSPPPVTFGRIWRAVTPSLLCCEFLPLTAHPNSCLLTPGREQPRLASASASPGLLKETGL